jgi:hypothetical protein
MRTASQIAADILGTLADNPGMRLSIENLCTRDSLYVESCQAGIEDEVYSMWTGYAHLINHREGFVQWVSGDCDCDLCRESRKVGG